MGNSHPNPNVSCAARFRQVTIGSADLHIEDIGGAPCRAIVFLSIGAGNLVVTPANPINPDLPDETFDVTNLPVGYLLPIEATDIKHTGSVSGLELLILW